MKENNQLTLKWFRILMCIAIVGLINSVLSIQPFISLSFTVWISRGLMLAMTVCMLKLAPVHHRYHKAGIYRGTMLALILITAFVFASSLLTIAASVLSIMAVYQEYSAHSDLVAELDPKLSRKWHSLFNWGIAAAVLVSFGSVVSVLLVVLLEADSVRTTALIVGLLSIPQLIIDVVYLVYIRKMMGYFEDREEVQPYDA